MSPEVTDGKRTPMDPPEEVRDEVHLARFAKAFEASARRWELVVYPSLFAFIVLAAYGFFLVYSLSKDMRALAINVDPEMNKHMSAMASSIVHLAETITAMNGTVATMGQHIDSMNTHMASMSTDTGQMSSSTQGMREDMARITSVMGDMSTKLNALEPITLNMAAMTEAMRMMTVSTGTMSRDIGRPLNFMNQFAPW